MTGNTHANQRRTPRPPTDGTVVGVVLLAVVGLLLLGGAFVVYVNANQSVALDNPFMRGDQAHAADFGPAIFLAVAGAVVLLLAAIIGSARRR